MSRLFTDKKNRNKVDKIKLAQRTIALLSSMIESGECHTARTKEMKTNALNGLDEVNNLLISGVVSSSVNKELLIAELDDKRCIGVEMNEDMWYLCRKETAQHLLDNYNITPK